MNYSLFSSKGLLFVTGLLFSGFQLAQAEINLSELRDYDALSRPPQLQSMTNLEPELTVNALGPPPDAHLDDTGHLTQQSSHSSQAYSEAWESLFLKTYNQRKLQDFSFFNSPNDYYLFSKLEDIAQNYTRKEVQLLRNTLQTTRSLAPLTTELKTLYLANLNQSYWVNLTNGESFYRLPQLIDLLSRADEEIIDSRALSQRLHNNNQRLETLQTALAESPSVLTDEALHTLVDIDLEYSWLFLDYIRRVSFGLENPHQPALSQRAQRVLFSYDFQRYAKALPPKNPYYTSLKAAYYHLSQSHNIHTPPLQLENTRQYFKLYHSDPRIPAIKAFLRSARYLNHDPHPQSTYYDDILRHAVAAYQSDMGLTPDGILGPRTLAKMKEPFDHRAFLFDKISLNLERARWLGDMPDNYIFVNTPSQDLQAFEYGSDVLSMKVVVGRKDRATPILNDWITGMIWNPTWTPPRSILEKDILPRAQRDPNYFARNNMKVFFIGREINPHKIDWHQVNLDLIRVVQQPSLTNSLGRVRFSLTNDQAIYLHDSPARALYNNNVRLFSSGCVRVENPILLSQYLLDSGGLHWSQERIRKKLEDVATKPSYTTLPQRIPIYLAYQTIDFDSTTNTISRHSDVYHWDTPLLEKLKQHSKSRVTLESP